MSPELKSNKVNDFEKSNIFSIGILLLRSL